MAPDPLQFTKALADAIKRGERPLISLVNHPVPSDAPAIRSTRSDLAIVLTPREPTP